MPKSRSTSLARVSRSDRWTAPTAEAMLAAAKRSGLTLCGFARRQGVDARRLYWWRHRLRAAGTAPELTFEELPQEAKGSPAARAEAPVVERFEIVLRGGRVVRVGASFDGEALRRLLAIAEEEPPC